MPFMRIPRHIIRVQLPRTPGRVISIEVCPGLAVRLPGLIRSIAGAGGSFIITDSTVARLYGRRLHRSMIEAGLASTLIQFPAGEASKNQTVLHGLHTALLGSGVRRDSLVVALGGGVAGDLAGFAAATILRGIRFVQVPTTLLAQVDSSTGGKVGIDHPYGKNLIGAFHQPEAVWIDPQFLGTLPRREFLNGIAEVVKIGVALDSTLFGFLERNAASLTPSNLRLLSEVIARSVGLKASIVERDEREAGLRRSLNLGHTIGHAVEAASGYRVPHGSGVAIGIAVESEIALRLGLISPGARQRIVGLLRAFGLPTAIPRRIDPALFRSALAMDKKGTAAGTGFTLPAGIGICALGVVVEPVLLRRLTGEMQ